MTIKNIFIPVLVIALGVLSLGINSVSAQEAYQYINTSGELQTIVAETPTQAIANAYNIAPTSGVLLVGGIGGGDPVTTPTYSGYFYQFVNTSGNIGSVYASSPEAAINTATNIAQHSGVIYVNSATSL